MKYDIKRTGAFKQGQKLMKKRGKDIRLMDEIIDKLANDESLPVKNQDHALTGNWKGYRECHIEPDWLLVYRKEEDKLILVLVRTGSHSDLGF